MLVCVHSASCLSIEVTFKVSRQAKTVTILKMHLKIIAFCYFLLHSVQLLLNKNVSLKKCV